MLPLVLQKREVKLPHVPENNSMYAPEAFRLAPKLLNVIVVVGATVAVNIYHTSSSETPPQEGVAIPELVAPTTVPAVFVHVTPGIRLIAPAQLSFAGGETCVTQIL